MAVIPRQDTFKSMYDDLERRIKALESAPVADRMSTQGGRFVVTDAAHSGSNAAVFGSDPTGASAGIGVWVGSWDAGATPAAVRTVLQVDSVNGWAKPGWPINMLPSPFGGGFYVASALATVYTASGTMTELYRCDFDGVGANISYDLVYSCSATTMDWQLQIEQLGGSLQTIASGTGVSGASQVVNTVAIPSSCFVPSTGTNPRGRSYSMRLSARVASGAGNVTAAPTCAWRNLG
jgi:hypothetical protein